MAARILIIEDNQTNLELMVYLLKAFGYVPLTASDGKEGLANALSTAPDLIICDLQMPGMDGYEFGRLLRTHSELQKVPLVAVTAFAMVGDRDRVLAAGFDGYIPKPINPEIFVKQVEAFLPPAKRSGLSPALVTSASRPAGHPQKRATVLVVDDSAINLSLIRSTLEPSGYEVIAVQKPGEAIELARKHTLHLIMCDLHMPGQTGLELLRQIKADSRLRSIPFLLFSASDTGGAEGEHALALGAKKFLCRPIEPQALLDAIEACLPNAKEH